MSSQKKFQQTIFDLVSQYISVTPAVQWELYVDGASRGNPGPSGAGIHLLFQKKTVLKKGFFIGEHTNNEAEYMALFIGVYLLKSHKKDSESVRIVSDSQLLIRQMQGVYKIKKEELKVLQEAIKKELEGIHCVFQHVERENNTVADSMANKGIDEKTTLPLKLLDLLRIYDIYL